MKKVVLLTLALCFAQSVHGMESTKRGRVIDIDTGGSEESSSDDAEITIPDTIKISHHPYPQSEPVEILFYEDMTVGEFKTAAQDAVNKQLQKQAEINGRIPEKNYALPRGIRVWVHNPKKFETGARWNLSILKERNNHPILPHVLQAIKNYGAGGVEAHVYYEFCSQSESGSDSEE